tara:strand:- start:1511 stop:2038 length:528 start_codon:yes stop_codon:yes gene_type:complete
MKNLIFFLILLFLYACSKPKSVLICGDHECVNKNEAEQYFRENLTLEVRILDKKDPNQIDLVELNLKSDPEKKKKISIFKKRNTNKKLKILSKKEIKNKKRELKILQKKYNKKDIKNKKVAKKLEESYKPVNKKALAIPDICTIIEKCSIDEISKYLVKHGKDKNFPDLSIRENK